jgi:hypothetical protein
MAEDLVSLSIAPADIVRLIEALDSHEYWQLSDPTWRHSGDVRLPNDQLDPWAEPEVPTAEERQMIAEIEACRRLQDALREASKSLS